VRERNVRLFEIGTVFHRSESEGLRPSESLRLAAVITGARVPPHWTAAGKAPDYDAWDLKFLFEQASALARPGATMAGEGNGWALKDDSGTQRGWAGPIDADRPAWGAPLFGFELEIQVGPPADLRFSGLPATPPLERDLALVVPAGVFAREVEALMRKSAGQLLESVTVFDEYRSADLGGRSVAWRLIFRAPDRTLRDEEADTAVKRVLAVLKEELGVRIRES